MKYFNSCITIEEVKRLYKKLAMENHPDRGGNTATMQSINTEYAFACAKLAKGAGLSDEEAETEIRLSEEYRQVIEKIINLPGIVIEIVGNWIWVTGNTLPVKATLKAAGFYFAAKKIAWYYRNEAFKTRGSGISLEQIRAKYGSETINRKQQGKVLED
ncbi:MAG: J domain-containing protein [Bacteroidetes bacterium]|nr:J domain-containing protein [Bacteroidota bacterium]